MKVIPSMPIMSKYDINITKTSFGNVKNLFKHCKTDTLRYCKDTFYRF